MVSFKSIQTGFFLGLLILTTLTFLGLLKDFMLPVFWAAVLAILVPLMAGAAVLARQTGPSPASSDPTHAHVTPLA